MIAAALVRWDCGKAYRGSDRRGQVMPAHGNVKHVYCGHSHFPIRADVGGIAAVNIGTGYRIKTFETLDV